MSDSTIKNTRKIEKIKNDFMNGVLKDVNEISTEGLMLIDELAATIYNRRNKKILDKLLDETNLNLEGNKVPYKSTPLLKILTNGDYLTDSNNIIKLISKGADVNFYLDGSKVPEDYDQKAVIITYHDGNRIFYIVTPLFMVVRNLLIYTTDPKYRKVTYNIVKKLLENGADINFKVADITPYYNALDFFIKHIGCHDYYGEMINLMVEKITDLENLDENTKTCLEELAIPKYVEYLKKKRDNFRSQQQELQNKPVVIENEQNDFTIFDGIMQQKFKTENDVFSEDANYNIFTIGNNKYALTKDALSYIYKNKSNIYLDCQGTSYKNLQNAIETDKLDDIQEYYAIKDMAINDDLDGFVTSEEFESLLGNKNKKFKIEKTGEEEKYLTTEEKLFDQDGYVSVSSKSTCSELNHMNIYKFVEDTNLGKRKEMMGGKRKVKTRKNKRRKSKGPKMSKSSKRSKKYRKNKI